MRKRLHMLMVIGLMLTTSLSAQNLLTDELANTDGTIGTDQKDVNLLWIDAPKSTGGAADIVDDPTGGTDKVLHLTSDSDGQANAISYNEKGTFDLIVGKTYIMKFDRYYVPTDESSNSTGEKFIMHPTTFSGITNGGTQVTPNVNFVNITPNVWSASEYEFEYTDESKTDGEVVSHYIRMQINPGACDVYYDNFYIEEKPEAPVTYEVTFNINRTVNGEDAGDNVWVTFDETSIIAKIGTDTESAVTFTSVLPGTYSYAALGKGYIPQFSGDQFDEVVVVDEDVTIDLTIERDIDNEGAQLVFYSNYTSDESIVEKENSVKKDERAGSSFVLKKGDDVIYANTGTGYWIGNLNTVGEAAGQIYTYRMEYTGTLFSSHPEVDNPPTVGSLKPREGFVPATIALSANDVNFYKYYGWFDAHFVVTDVDGNAINAKVTITEAGLTDLATGTNGIYMAELEDDGTIFNYTVAADGYQTISGTISQDLDVTKDKLIELSLDVSTNIDKDITSGIKVYPNPTTSLLNIAAPEGSQINVISIAGSKVRSLAANASVTQIEVSDLAKGIYLIEVISNGTKLVEKVQIN